MLFFDFQLVFVRIFIFMHAFVLLFLCLSRYDGPETAMKRRIPLDYHRNIPPDRPPPWRHDFPGSYGGGYGDSHRDEARTFYSGDDGSDFNDLGGIGKDGHNSQSYTRNPEARTRHNDTTVQKPVTASHRPDYYGPPLTPTKSVSATRAPGNNGTFQAQSNNGAETYYSHSNTYNDGRTSRQSSGTFPLGSEGGDTR